MSYKKAIRTNYLCTMKTIYFSLCFLLLSISGFAQTGNASFVSTTSLKLPDTKAIDSSNCDCKNEKTIENTHPLEAYTDKISYAPGEVIKLYVHTLSSPLVVMLTHHLSKDVTIKTVNNVCAAKQNYTSCSFKYGCNWSPSLYLKLADDIESGYYSLKVVGKNNVFYASFIIRPKTETLNKILIVASTNTWQAYNTWGGASFYKFFNENPCNIKFAEFVNLHRPNNETSPINKFGAHLLNAELFITRWLEQKKYTYDVISDDDLDRDSTILEKYKVVIFSTHTEYWTANMLQNVENYVNQKGNIMYLSGNGLYWKVTWQGDMMECRKLGEVHTQTGDIGGRWRDIGKPESAILGVEYDNKGIATYAPFKVLLPNHWIFASTGVVQDQIFGQQSSTGMKDETGASGHETDKVTSFSPSNILILAHGMNPSMKDSTDFGAGGADMTFYERPYGGAVFSAGSISYGGSLSIDSVCSRITQNVLENFLHR